MNIYDDVEVFVHDEVVINPRNQIGCNLSNQYILDAAAWKAKQEIMEEEDRRIFEALDAIASEGKF